MSLNSEEYWRKREEEQRKQDIKDLKEYRKYLEGIYKRTLADVSSQIRAFYNQYAQKTGMTYAEARKKADKLDIEAFAEKAKQYVKDKDFSQKANEEMRLYNMTMKANRLELLKAQIGLELCSTADEIDKFMKEELRGRTLEEIERQAGILGQSLVNNKEFANALINASFHNATFSDRIWVNQSALRNNLDSILKNALIQGRNPRDFIPELRKIFDVSRYQAERLLRTELARVQTEAQMQSYKRNGFTQYKFMALGSACEICAAINGDVFDVEDAEPGLNMPPMHPNCMCSTAPYEDTTDFDNWLNGIDEHGLTFDEWRKSAVSEKGNSYRTGTNRVDLDYIRSSSYRRKFNQITDNSKVNDAIRQYATASLVHRNGTDGEDLYIVNAKTGELLLRKISSKNVLEVNVKREEIASLLKNKTSLIGIHNHPTNILPTGSDFAAAGYRNYKFGVIVTHDGRVFKYSSGNRPFLASLLDNRIEKYQGKEYNLSKEEAHIKALNEFRKEYGITWEEIKN